MSTYFKLYENIDKIDPTELKRAAGIKDPEKVVWPKGKKYKIQLSGKECSVTTSFTRLEERVYGNLDAYSALSTMLTREEVVERMWKEDPNGHTDAVDYAYAEFLPGLPTLSYEEIEHRKAFTAAILTLISDQKTIEAIAECAPRKKNGLFHKGRVFKIGLTGLAEKYSSELIEIVGKSKDETKLTISVLGRNTSPDELEAWTQDFISTYHAGLPISEALKTVFKAIDPDMAFDDTTEKDDGLEQSLESRQNKLTIPDKYKAKTKAPSYTSKETLERWEEEKAFYCQYIDEIEEIDLNNKIVVFDSSICAMGAFRTDPDNPIVKKVMDAGVAGVRNAVSSKTDYFFVSTDDPWLNTVGEGWKKAIEQRQKGKPIKIVTIKNLLSILDL